MTNEHGQPTKGVLRKRPALSLVWPRTVRRPARSMHGQETGAINDRRDPCSLFSLVSSPASDLDRRSPLLPVFLKTQRAANLNPRTVSPLKGYYARDRRDRECHFNNRDYKQISLFWLVSSPASYLGRRSALSPVFLKTSAIAKR